MQKSKYFQCIRGLCIISVVTIHLLSEKESLSINNFNIVIRTIVNFCVGLFIFLSGYFVNIEKVKDNAKKWITGRAKRLGIPFLIFSALAATIEMIKNGDSIFKYIIHIILGMSSAQLYYIVVLIQLVIITPIIVKIIESKKRIINGIVIGITPIYLLILAIINIKFAIQIPLYQTIFFGWILYYYLGIYYKINKECIKIEKILPKKIFWGSILLIIIRSLINIYIYKKGVSYSYVTSQLTLLNMIYILYTILVVLKLENKVKNIKCLEKLGDISFGIYFIHTYFIKMYNHIFDIDNYYIKLIIGILFVVSLSYLTIVIFKKITKNKFNKILGF